MYYQIQFIYQRYFKSYKNEIIAFLQNKDLELLEIAYPTENDWKNSPFEKNKGLFKFYQIEIGNFPFVVSKDFLIVIAFKGTSKKKFWLEIRASPFQKPKFLFKENGFVDTLKISFKNNYIEVLDKCPACGFKLKTSDLFCPDCELKF
ncbi:hypothetical protein FLGE108171_01755 [Flavobacterium gelidilacus]|uniref:hypothetical protein n=1 Tax=Flavobacterium gelidilacus TaxID=206041 RepID=UPI0003FAFB06|nr:hypothetical protein [Flavobacterium gelidilacus]